MNIDELRKQAADFMPSNCFDCPFIRHCDRKQDPCLYQIKLADYILKFLASWDYGRMVECPHCGGTGQKRPGSVEFSVPCTICNGKKEIYLSLKEELKAQNKTK